MASPTVTPNPLVADGSAAAPIAPGVSPDEVAVSEQKGNQFSDPEIQQDYPQDCFGNYTASMGPFFNIMKNPIGHLGKGFGGIFSISHEDDETTLKAIGTWLAIKMYMVVLVCIMELIFVGIIIGFMGVAITWFILGLILGFLASHLMWWIAVFYMHDVCCSTNRYLVTGLICAVGALFGCLGLLTHMGKYSIWAEYLAVDICSLLSAVCSAFAAILLIKLHMDVQKRGSNQQPAGDQVTVVVLPDADGAAPPAAGAETKQ